MSKQEIFTKTARIQKGITLINDTDASKYPLLLSRVLQRLDVSENNFFTDDEKEKLTSSLSLTADQLDLLLDTTVFILQQAAHHNCKPAVLHKELKKLEINDEKCENIVEVWTKSAKEVVEKLKRKTLHKEELESVKWQLNLNMGQSTMSKLKDPSAILEFGLKSGQMTNGGENVKTVSVEFDHESLYKFYNQLELIQAHMDSLI